MSVVPLSSNQPDPLCPWHLPIDLDVPGHWGSVPRWAKCDMIATVAYDRLSRPFYRHPVTDTRLFWQHTVSADLLGQLRRSVALALGIDIVS